MLIDGLFNFLNFIVAPSDQPQKYIAFVGVALLVNVLVALLDLKWGRGIAFTALALLATAFYVCVSVVMVQVIQHDLDMELTEPQGWGSFGVNIGIAYWYIFELPILLSLGVGAVILAVASRQRGWIIGSAIALALTVVAPFLAAWITGTLSAGADIFNPRSIYDRDMRLLQAHLAFVIGLFAVQLVYLSYGVWRIWRSVGLRRRPAAATPLPSAQS